MRLNLAVVWQLTLLLFYAIKILSPFQALKMTAAGDAIEATFQSQIIAPIIAEGDAIGAVIVASKEPNVKMGELELKLAETAASFLAKQMEQ